MLSRFSFLLFIMISSSAFAMQLSDDQKIEYMLNDLKASGATVTRNNVQISAKDAAEDLRNKWKTSRTPINTPEDFIDKVGTLSSHSGVPYIIKLPDGRLMTSAEWFRDKLFEIDRKYAK